MKKNEIAPLLYMVDSLQNCKNETEWNGCFSKLQQALLFMRAKERAGSSRLNIWKLYLAVWNFDFETELSQQYDSLRECIKHNLWRAKSLNEFNAWLVSRDLKPVQQKQFEPETN